MDAIHLEPGPNQMGGTVRQYRDEQLPRNAFTPAVINGRESESVLHDSERTLNLGRSSIGPCDGCQGPVGMTTSAQLPSTSQGAIPIRNTFGHRN